MRGMMMDYPLTLQHFLDRNRRLFGSKEIISRTSRGEHRYTYDDYHVRVNRLAHALHDLGVGRGDRVASFAWNTHRHLELYYAVPCMGAVLHTVNIRLAPENISYIINDGGARVLAVDSELLPAMRTILPNLDSVEQIILMQDEAEPDGRYLDYEELLSASPTEFEWPALDENDAAGICYSSGTTGNSKGVVYSHRAIFLHSMSVATVDSLALCESDRIMPVVPMFHANAWGLPHASVAVGATPILPGPAPTPTDLLDLIQRHRVTVAAGVPTVWIGVLTELRKREYDLSSVRCFPCGGSAPPPSLIESYERESGVPLLHAWGMTETAPIATICRVKSGLRGLPKGDQLSIKAKQGLPVLGIDLTVMDDDGNEVPWDGTTMGEIVVRGPWVIAGYLHADAPERFTHGWFRTGDVAVVDPEGYVQIVDRTKDLVKSGGEWISSVEVEGVIMGHPDVLEAAVIAVPDERWGERPLALVVLREGSDVTPRQILDFVAGKVAKFAVPDEVRFITEVPKTSVGKFDKKALRQQHVGDSAAAIGAPQ